MTEEKIEDAIDESVYDPPYVVKSGCLYEMVQIKDQTVPIKLADFVPVLVAEITRDDGTEQTKQFRNYFTGGNYFSRGNAVDEMAAESLGSIRSSSAETKCSE